MEKKPLKPFKVVHLITLLEMGGAQGNTLHTVRHLDPKQFDIQLWAGPGAYWDDAAETDLGKQGRLRFFPHLVRSIHPLFDLLAYFDLRKAFKEQAPALVHTHSSKAGILGRLAARHARVPILIHTFHGFGFNDRQNPLLRRLFIWLEQITATFSTALIFVSKSNMETARQLRIGDPDNYHLIRSGVPTAEILKKAAAAKPETVRRDLGIPTEAPLITTIGPFKPQKNLSDFIEAAGLIHKERPEAHFLLVGDGALRASIERHIKQKNLENVFHLPGWRQDIPEILAATTVFALTSLWEGLPRSLVEALIVGVPAVCYDTDGVSDLLAKGGRVVPQGDVAGLTAEILFLLRDKEIRKKASIKSKELIGKDFDIDEMVRQQEKLYQTLLTGH